MHADKDFPSLLDPRTEPIPIGCQTYVASVDIFSPDVTQPRTRPLNGQPPSWFRSNAARSRSAVGTCGTPRPLRSLTRLNAYAAYRKEEGTAAPLTVKAKPFGRSANYFPLTRRVIPREAK
jgi:hypothetical protein